MKRLTFFLTIIFIFPISLLPFWFLYRISDLLYFILYYIIKYRRTVTRRNLVNSFPEKSESSIINIEKEFYRHLADVFVESIKSYTVSHKQMLKRMPVMNREVFDGYFEQGKSITVATAHFGNWEWAALALCIQTNHINQAVYRPLSNPYFDRMVRKNRGKFSLELIPEFEVIKFMRKKYPKPVIRVLLADQSPTDPHKGYWTLFLNQDTAYSKAVERLTKISGTPLVFGEIRKVKRGYYEIHLHKLADNPNDYDSNELTEMQMKKLESLINESPPYWLWSHRRWKHKRRF